MLVVCCAKDGLTRTRGGIRNLSGQDSWVSAERVGNTLLRMCLCVYVCVCMCVCVLPCGCACVPVCLYLECGGGEHGLESHTIWVRILTLPLLAM